MSCTIDADHTWKFDVAGQLTAPNYLCENIGFGGGDEGDVQMDFTQPMDWDDSISTLDSATVTNIVGATEPTISQTAVSDDKKKAVLTLSTASATANTYTFNVTVTTTNGQTIVRKGRLVLS